MYLAGLVVIVCIFQGVTAPPGSTKLCRNCHRLVRGPAECMEFHHCKHPCVTDVYQSNGENMFMYSCYHEPECPADSGHLHGPGGPGHIHEHNHEHGTHVCRECCHSNDCDQHTCSQFFHTTPTTTTTTPAPTPAPTTTLPDPSATTKGMTTIVQTSASTAIQNCTDTASNVFTCADMKYFGYCDPAAGSGYALAQKMCRVTCGFCP